MTESSKQLLSGLFFHYNHYEKLEKALTQSLRDSEVDCIHKYLSAKFSDEAIDALVKEMEGRHDE